VRLARRVLAVAEEYRGRSRPSITGSAGSLPPATATKVGKRSMVPATASLALLGAILPGHQAIVGTRTPPSHVLPLPARSGFALPPSAPFTSHGPLSLVKITSVRSVNFNSRRVSNTCPTLQSTSSTQSPNRPLAELLSGVDPRVDRRVRQVQEERLVLVRADESDGLRGASFDDFALLLVGQQFGHRVVANEGHDSLAGRLRVPLHVIGCRSSDRSPVWWAGTRVGRRGATFRRTASRSRVP